MVDLEKKSADSSQVSIQPIYSNCILPGAAAAFFFLHFNLVQKGVNSFTFWSILYTHARSLPRGWYNFCPEPRLGFAIGRCPQPNWMKCGSETESQEWFVVHLFNQHPSLVIHTKATDKVLELLVFMMHCSLP